MGRLSCGSPAAPAVAPRGGEWAGDEVRRLWETVVEDGAGEVGSGDDVVVTAVVAAQEVGNSVVHALPGGGMLPRRTMGDDGNWTSLAALEEWCRVGLCLVVGTAGTVNVAVDVVPVSNGDEGCASCVSGAVAGAPEPDSSGDPEGGGNARSAGPAAAQRVHGASDADDTTSLPTSDSEEGTKAHRPWWAWWVW